MLLNWITKHYVAWANKTKNLLPSEGSVITLMLRESQNLHKLSETSGAFSRERETILFVTRSNLIVQETVMYKDEQLREAQGWIAPAQEMDALQITPCRLNCENVPSSITSSGLVAKDSLRRWMERLHVHTVQQLKLDLANVKEGGGLKTKSNGASHSQTFQNRAGQVTPLHSFVMHQQEILKPQGTSPPHVAQSAKGAVPASSQLPMQNHVHPSQDVHGLVRSDATSEYQVHAKGQSLVQGYQTSHGAQFGSTTPSSSVNEQVVESGNGSNTSENNFQDISSQFRDALRLDSNALTQKPEVCEQNGAKTLVSSGNAERNLESALLDERSLLACIVVLYQQVEESESAQR
ncbi:unnamed protein product [Brassica napus]|uniref:(rape) hypothetical protein n=1 Tax=Brassica napus TaxID=3708 RepID=A0A816JQQ8_BRANA|nr:unnamed protein product [Brassica napus]